MYKSNFLKLSSVFFVCLGCILPGQVEASVSHAVNTNSMTSNIRSELAKNSEIRLNNDRNGNYAALNDEQLFLPSANTDNLDLFFSWKPQTDSKTLETANCGNSLSGISNDLERQWTVGLGSKSNTFIDLALESLTQLSTLDVSDL